MFGFFLSYFFITVANTVKCNTCNNIRNSIYKERRKKNEKKPSVFCTLFFYRRPIVPL